jgi:uncharacterized protein
VKPVLLDTSAIVALLDRTQAQHLQCAMLMESLDGPLVTCEGVITEACYLLRKMAGAVKSVLENVDRGVFQIGFELSRSAAAVRGIMRKYRDVPADFADACLIHLADELNTADILTLDRDFMLYRWHRNFPFHLLLEP